MNDFKGKALGKGVSLPTEMWEWLDALRERTGIPASRFIQDAIEEKIARDTQPANVLVDGGWTYETEAQ